MRRDEPVEHSHRCAIYVGLPDSDEVDDDLACTCGAVDEDSDRAADIAADRREIAASLRGLR